MAILEPKGIHLVVVPLAEKQYRLRRWASQVGGFTAIDLDCSLAPILPEGGGMKLILEVRDMPAVERDIYGLAPGGRTLLLNSLGTVQACARMAAGDRDWSRLYLRYVVHLVAACRARADSTLFIINSIREGGAKSLLGAGWVRLCSLSLDGTWMLSEDGLRRLP